MKLCLSVAFLVIGHVVAFDDGQRTTEQRPNDSGNRWLNDRETSNRNGNMDDQHSFGDMNSNDRGRNFPVQEPYDTQIRPVSSNYPAPPQNMLPSMSQIQPINAPSDTRSSEENHSNPAHQHSFNRDGQPRSGDGLSGRRPGNEWNRGQIENRSPYGSNGRFKRHF